MTDAECVALLQWALPRLGLRWQGYRRVRRQVCRRIHRRLAELGISDVAAYRAYLEATPDEWRRLDGLCHVTISRFYRDRGVFDFLRRAVLPEFAREAAGRRATIVPATTARLGLAIEEAADRPFEPHERVAHADWGDGTVQRYEGDKMVVLFDDAGYKTLGVELVRERGLLRKA